jgi:hypothetical protein
MSQLSPKLLTRFKQIWITDFLEQFISSNEKPRTTWKFWFFYSTIVAFLISILVFFSIRHLIKTDLSQEDFTLRVENGQITTENISQPLKWSLNDGTNLAVIVDLEQEIYSLDDLSNFSNGIFVTQEEVKLTFPDLIGMSTITYKAEDLDSFEFSPASIKSYFNEHWLLILSQITVVSWLVISIFNLLSVAFYALLFFLGGKIMSIKNWTYSQSFWVTLNFMVAVLALHLLFLSIGTFNPYTTSLTLLVLFSLNFWHTRRAQDGLAD